MKAILPFFMKSTPMQKLALINFDKNPDRIYSGLELQYLQGEIYGTGYRVLAYRNDGYVDMYDDTSLTYNAEENCNVAGKGLKNHVQTSINDTVFEALDGKVQISFEFLDIEQRPIHVYIQEQTTRKSIPMNLLAPIGVSSEKPTYLPVFFLYDFDFVRRAKTIVDITINGQPIKIDPFPFPVPMNGQFRYYTRYTLNSRIVDFLPTDMQVIEVELDEKLQYLDGNIKYQFMYTEQGIGLSSIEILDDEEFSVQFTPAFVLDHEEGVFSIPPRTVMGHIDGTYKVNKDGSLIRIQLIPSKGWSSVPTSRITKLLLSPKSIFCSWCKNYRYTSTIDLDKMTSRAEWVNENLRDAK